MQKKQLYIAYGSNINLEQMAYRCPHSKVVGTSEIKDFELEFRGVATIVPNKGTTVPVLIWELDERDLPTLNKYEGWPRIYRQEKMNFEMDGRTFEGMAYLKNRGEISPPSQQYYNTILQGYRENGLDESFLQRALENSFQMDIVEEEIDEDFDIDEFEDIEYDDFQMELYGADDMKYKGFFVKFTPDNYLPRETEDGEVVACEGFKIEVFADESEKIEIDIFSAAVDFELVKNSINEAEQFAKDYIDCVEKEYCRMLDEFNSN